METLTDDEKAELDRQTTAIPASWWILPSYAWVGGLVVGIVCLFWFRQVTYQAVALLATLYCTDHLAYRAGLLHGYREGYESGHVGGVRKALGVAPRDADEIHDRAVEMKIDGSVIKGLEGRKNQVP